MNPGEQPLFSTKAHVFQIDPDTKKNWIPATKQATNISYYYDNSRNSYRIIGVDGQKAVVNSVITPNMTFTKTSQKFGQWLDPRANIVYGLGFPTEVDLTKFIEKFKEIKDLTRQNSSQLIQEINGGSDNQTGSPLINHKVHHSRNSSISSIQSSDSGSLRERRNSLTQGGQNATTTSNSQTEVQLKYENDRLKLALAQSSGNAKKWEVELQTLKNNNARLTAALQESTSNVDEWKKQLASYKEDCNRLKTKMLEMEESHQQKLQQEVKSLQQEVEQLQQIQQSKDKEIDELVLKFNNMSSTDDSNTALQSRIQTLEEENHDLSVKVEDLQRLLGESRVSQDRENSDLIKLQEQLGHKVTELYELHEQIVSTIKKESNS
ncbi:homer protein homolog 2 [Patella vulgata]|uniref:homer protein homolog 2 n=1 Tax=Patella vulgata TaxID=6465 RepID=UPI00218034D9|nr:homer protein homolog 2 [Patella vulgata]